MSLGKSKNPMRRKCRAVKGRISLWLIHTGRKVCLEPEVWTDSQCSLCTVCLVERGQG